MRYKIFAFLLIMNAVYVFSQDDEWYQGKPIRDIVFSGLKNVKLSEIEALINPYKGRTFDDDIFWEIQGKLYALEYFERIEPSALKSDNAGSEVIIRFTVVELPVISRINFAGNSGLRRGELSEVISIKVNDVVNQTKIRADIEAIKNKYIEKGYPNVTVQAAENRTGDSSVTLVFNITEHEKITIRRFEFQGNEKFKNNTLRSQLSLKAKSLINDGAFQEAKLIADREAINKYYHDRGYIKAEVRDITRTYDNDSKGTGLILTFLIDEGSQYTFGGIVFEGNNLFSTDQLSKLVNTKKGDIVNLSRLEADMERVSDLYYENGYIFNTILRTPDWDEQANTISYTITIVERGRAHIENVIIRGNSKTKTEVILREIPLEPGDVFSKTKVYDAMRNLYNLQFFSYVMPETPQGSTESLMDLIFNVEEQPTTDLQFGLTFSGSTDPDNFPVSGLIKWDDRNFLGTGNQIGAEINSTVIDTTSVSLNYLHRWIFGLPLSGSVDFSASFAKHYIPMNNNNRQFYGDEIYAYPDGFYSYDEYYIHSKLPPREYLMEINQSYLSIGLSTGYRWTTFMGNLSLNGGVRFGVIRNEYDNTLYRPFDPTYRNGNNEWIPKNSFWAATSLDQRDIFYDPSGGYYAYQRIGLYGIMPVEREHYMRSDTKLEYYITLWDIPVTEAWSFKGVFALHSGLSFIFKQPGRDADSLIPPVEDQNKLSVDGMFVGRGWSTEYRNKGLLLFDNWAELRLPVVRGILALDLFFDTAGVETVQGYYFGKNDKGNQNFTLDNLRFSYGGGIRFTMPQFPFRLSLAKRFRFINGKLTWESGAIFGNSDNPAMGMDLVISFVMSY
ncbi:MAG: outer membrane protein assembly factor BamA [Treponema sp.]|jgi:outer membrane protein insertion porin family|nr:outer membrane protein assembly factor BamA [Treponema sp.]